MSKNQPSVGIAEQFLLDPDVTFLNHGSFGACPRPVFEEYQRWQRELERQPVAFLIRRYESLLNPAREALAEYIHADPQDLTFAPNVTVGINGVIRSLDLQPGDEVLGNNHEYGAMTLTWQHICTKVDARYVIADLSVPVHSTGELVDQLWSQVTSRTRVIFLSHITSPTALIFPVEEICRRARERGIITVIDGAHAIGQIPVDLQAIDADYYAGNCHKWLCAPKGAGFLYVRRDLQADFDPLVLGWGLEADNFVDRNRWQGTQDIAAYLAIPAAIEFQRDHDWAEVRRRCHALAVEAQRRISDLTGLPPLSPTSESWFVQMVSVALGNVDWEAFPVWLYERHMIEVPTIAWKDGTLLRISFQGYNTADDLARLLDALTAYCTKRD